MALHLFHKFFLQWSTPWANQLQVLFGRKSTGGALSYRFWQEIPWQPERRSIIQRTRHCTFETLENTRFSTILQRPVQNTVLCAIAHNSCRDRLTINSATPWSTFPQNSTYKVTSPSQEFHHIYTFVEPSSDSVEDKKCYRVQLMHVIQRSDEFRRDRNEWTPHVTKDDSVHVS